MASAAAVINVLSENLRGNGEKEIRGRITLGTYDRASNPWLNLANYLASGKVATVLLFPSAQGYVFLHNGGTAAAGTIVALTAQQNVATGAPLIQVANGTALGSTIDFVAIGPAD